MFLKYFYRSAAIMSKCLIFQYGYSVTVCVVLLTVPVRCDHQVKCVPGVLSMGSESPHMYGVRTSENEMKPLEILEKMQFK